MNCVMQMFIVISQISVYNAFTSTCSILARLGSQAASATFVSRIFQGIYMPLLPCCVFETVWPASRVACFHNLSALPLLCHLGRWWLLVFGFL